MLLEAKDGAFDSVSKVAVMEFDMGAWEDGGKHIFYFQAVDVAGEAGAIFCHFGEKSMAFEDAWWTRRRAEFCLPPLEQGLFWPLLS